MATHPIGDRSSSTTAAIATNRQLSSPERKFDQFEDDMWYQVTKVLVGEEEKLYYVHTHILRKVPFFRGCLDVEMIEKKENCVRLPEDRPDAFDVMIHRLYHERLPFDILTEAEVFLCFLEGLDLLEFKHMYIYLVLTYIMAQKFLLEGLQNHILDIHRTLSADLITSGEELEYLLENLPAGDRLLELLRQDIACNIRRCGGWFRWKQEGYSQYTNFAINKAEYMKLVIGSMVRYPYGTSPSKGGMARDLHVHINTPKCRAVSDNSAPGQWPLSPAVAECFILA